MTPLIVAGICIAMAVAAQAIELRALERIGIFTVLAFLSNNYALMAITCIISLCIQGVWWVITRPTKPPRYSRPVTDWLDL